MTDTNNIPLNTLIAVDVSSMTGADVYAALTTSDAEVAEVYAALTSDDTPAGDTSVDVAASAADISDDGAASASRTSGNNATPAGNSIEITDGMEVFDDKPVSDAVPQSVIMHAIVDYLISGQIRARQWYTLRWT
jgi:hypothetical protein